MELEESDKTIEAIRQIADDAWRSAKDRVRAQKLDPFDEGRVYAALYDRIGEKLGFDDTFSKNPRDFSEACCTQWSESKDQLSHYWTEFRFCPFCNAEFKQDE